MSTTRKEQRQARGGTEGILSPVPQCEPHGRDHGEYPPDPGVPSSTMRTRIKLCGMFRREDIDVVNEVRPDYVGFVVDVPRSHRSVSATGLAALATRVAPGICRVGVFVDEPIRTVARLYEEGLIDVAQLHGHEDERYLSQLRAACPVPTIQAFRVRSVEDVRRAQASTANLVLLDNGQGTGQTFDWSLLDNVGRPFMLAGGLGPANVAEAIAATHPWGVDMSSGIETDRVKDPVKIAAAVAAMRHFEEAPNNCCVHDDIGTTRIEGER